MAQDKTRYSDFERGRRAAFQELINFLDDNPNWVPDRKELKAAIALFAKCKN